VVPRDRARGAAGRDGDEVDALDAHYDQAKLPARSHQPRSIGSAIGPGEPRGPSGLALSSASSAVELKPVAGVEGGAEPEPERSRDEQVRSVVAAGEAIDRTPKAPQADLASRSLIKALAPSVGRGGARGGGARAGGAGGGGCQSRRIFRRRTPWVTRPAMVMKTQKAPTTLSVRPDL
jgi:hypothetical protein